jgi:uncharacterized phage protein (TIGR01671 family)
MRELKFRAWDKFNACFWESDGKNLSEFFTRMQYLIDGDNELIFQQYTGMKDKKGKEIYEGDIIHFKTSFENDNDDYDYSEKPFVIEWNKHAAAFKPFHLNARWRCDVEGVEVIGNIYENPELL